MNTRITPTFLLKGINPHKLLADYKAGLFSTLSENNSKIIISNNNAILAPVYGTSNRDPIFTVKDKNNNSVVIATTGHENYEIFMAGNGESFPDGGRCDFCKDDFTHKSVGYPVAYRENKLLISDNLPHYRTIYTFWCDGTLCSFECTLGEIRKSQCRPTEFRDTMSKDSESMLHNLYKLMHPKKGILLAAKEPKLRKIKGGSLSEEEWKSRKHIYVKTDRIIMLPVKIEYLQYTNYENLSIL